MTRMKKIEIDKYNESTKNMSEEDKEVYDLLLSLKNKFNGMAQELHIKLFSEEYNYIYDSGADANDRGRGKNPMSQDYIDKMDKKRVKLGFSPLQKGGNPSANDDTMEYCRKIITGEVEFN